MRLVCSVSMQNLISTTQGIQARSSRKVRSSVSVFEKRNETFLMWCTAKNKNGTRYKLHNNVEKCFTKMADKGVATIRLKNPQIDLQISDADGQDLRRLLNATNVANKGQSLLGKGVLSTAEPVKNKVIKKPQTKMRITCQKSYLQYLQLSAIPSSLERLSIDNCEIVKFDLRILELRHLTHLCLSHNQLSSLPDEVSQMQNLVDLNLEHNRLTQLPSTFCSSSSKLCSCLRSLNLNDNEMQLLPDDFGNLKELYQVHLHRNKLRFLPFSIGFLKNLKIVNASNNQIRIIPISIKWLSLDSIDLYRNDFMEVGFKSVVNNLGKFKSLQELTANFIVKNRIPTEEGDLTYFCQRYLQRARKCLFCPNFVFRQYARIAISLDLYRVSQIVTHYDARWRKNAPVDIQVCSTKCFRRLRFINTTDPPTPTSVEKD